MTYETPIEPTLGQVMKRINLVRKDLAKKLANTQQREWDAQPVREMCNHEKELHTALMVLRDLAGDQGAFAAGAPEVSAAVAGPDKEREAFEAWAAHHAASQSWTSIEREGDSYAGIIAKTAWSAWQARGAAPALEAPAALGEWQIVENTGTGGHAAGFYAFREAYGGNQWMQDKKRRIACFTTHAQAAAAIAAAAPQAPAVDLCPHLAWALRRISTSLGEGEHFAAAQQALDAAQQNTPE